MKHVRRDERSRALSSAVLRSTAAALLLGLFCARGSTLALGGEATVPPMIQAALMLRIFEYDRALKSWATPDLAVGIVTKRAESSGMAELRKALAAADAQGMRPRSAEHVYRDSDALGTWIDKSGIRFLCVSADIGAEAKTIFAVASAHKIPALALTRGQFDGGGALGIVVKEGKPHILVNLGAARAAGMDLDPKLLQLAEVVR